MSGEPGTVARPFEVMASCVVRDRAQFSKETFLLKTDNGISKRLSITKHIFSNESSMFEPYISFIFYLDSLYLTLLVSLRPRPYCTVFKRKRYCFIPDTATVHTTTPKTISENGSFRKRSIEWNDLKTVLFENAVFLVWTAKTILSENDDVTTTAVDHSTVRKQTLSYGFLVDRCDF